MQQIINFILRNKTFLLFVSLFVLGLFFTIQSHSYHKSKFINSANVLTGGLYNTKHKFSNYFNLKTQNQLLQEENRYLKSILYNLTEDSIGKSNLITPKANYAFKKGIIIKNNYTFKDNILLLNKGKQSGVKQDFGVITPKGILGIIQNTSKNYATVLSVLNSNSRISAVLKNSNHYGSLKWNSKSPDFVQLTEIPQKAKIKIGDTIVTSGRSAIFPKGIPIGTVNQFKLDNAKNYFEIEVKLFNDMTNVNEVYIIEHIHKKEIDSLLPNTTNE